VLTDVSEERSASIFRVEVCLHLFSTPVVDANLLRMQFLSMYNERGSWPNALICHMKYCDMYVASRRQIIQKLCGVIFTSDL
jgi:hypothetical protein